ncbi:MAG: hypothetical protein ACLSAH_19455 [Bilophila wadsworthia]
MNEIQQLCDEAAGTNKVLQGNIAFAVGCARGYPRGGRLSGTQARRPSTRACRRHRTGSQWAGP